MTSSSSACNHPAAHADQTARSRPALVPCQTKGTPMAAPAATGLWHRFDHAEQSLCLRINRSSRHVPVRRFFAVISRLGDGVFWYLLLLAFALSGPQGAIVAAQMALAGIVGTVLYRQLKHRLVRERPFISHAGIRLGAVPLDRYSFPSGHTLHAVCFTLIATAHVPGLATDPRAIHAADCRVARGAWPALPHGRARRGVDRRRTRTRHAAGRPL